MCCTTWELSAALEAWKYRTDGSAHRVTLFPEAPSNPLLERRKHDAIVAIPQNSGAGADADD